MKRLFVILTLLIAHAVGATERVNIRISKPFALLTFIRAGADDPHVSKTLAVYVRGHIPKRDSVRFYKAVFAFAQLELENSLVFSEYPEARQKPRSLAGMLNNAAIRANTVEEFLSNIVGMIPNERWMRLKASLQVVEPMYDKIMLPYDDDLRKQQQALAQYSEATDAIFSKLKRFYGSTWSNAMPFTISLFAIPGAKGNSTAAPYSNTLALGVLTKETEHEMRMGVAIHEICHVLYEEQPLRLQWALDSAFVKSKSLYAPYAYAYFDEALATACGNGWAYRQLAGHDDTGEWYNDEYINGFAKAIYPLVRSYIAEGRAIDRSFVKKAIALFEKTFPKAPYAYASLFNSINFYTDAVDHVQYRTIYKPLESRFRITSSSGSYPITDKTSLEQLGSSTGPQLIVVHTNHKVNWAMLKEQFPEMVDLNAADEGIISFIDGKKRPVTIINVHSLPQLNEAFDLLLELKEINPSRKFTPLR
ncbi:MAG: hypothetical protein KF744_03405 [Taibaiella sp.]|nr:hypothetical protein [Taibaiella sp.]